MNSDAIQVNMANYLLSIAVVFIYFSPLAFVFVYQITFPCVKNYTEQINVD